MIRKKDEFPLIPKDNRYEQLEEYLSPSTGDSIHSGIKIGLSIIPGFGGVIAEIFSRAVESPLEKRKREFLIAMAIKLDDLEKASLVHSEDYRNDDEFLDILLQSLEIAGLVVIFPNLVEMNQWEDSSEQNLLATKSVSLVMRISIPIMQNFVIIYAVYWVGRKLGGNASWGRAVTILSFCLIPSIIGTMGLGVATSFTTNYLYLEEADNSLDFDQDLSPSYTIDFFSSTIMSNVFAVFFGGWTLLLLVKATRILNGFSLKNAIITIAASIGILFLLHIVFGAAMGVLGALSRVF